MSEIKNIIFDLGGVILNLDINKTISEFNILSKLPFETIYTQLQQTPLFDLFDKGSVSEQDFLIELKQYLKDDIETFQVINAWNAMLLDFPLHRLLLLKKLSENYRIFLLSNTNEIHIAKFEFDLFNRHGYENLEPFFEKVYYSCRIGMRKPDSEIFSYVLNQNDLKAEETIFIDDSPQHIIGATKTGIKSYLIPSNIDIKDFLESIKINH